MRVLIACEFSGILREAFKAKGHDAWSCDLLDTEILGQHIKGDVLEILNDGWDLMIAHPPCTHLAVAGAVHWKNKPELQQQAIKFFTDLIEAPISKCCIENPPGIMSSVFRKPDQYIHPYYFGHEAQKAFGLWLKNLPLLKHFKQSDLFDTKTHVSKGEIYITKAGKSRGGAWTMKLLPSEDRWKIRSRTFTGIAEAMAEQWG